MMKFQADTMISQKTNDNRLMQYSMMKGPMFTSRCIPCWIISLGLAMLLSGLASPPADAMQETDPPKLHREIFVPFEDLNVLLDRNSNRVMLERDEYEKLLEAAKTREIRRAPQDSVMVQAQYQGRVVGGIATISGTLMIEPLNDGLVAVPLSLSGVALRAAQLDNQPAKLWRDEKGQILLLLSGKGRQKLTLEMTVPMQTTAASQSMTLQLPVSGPSNFHLTVPGNVEVKSGLPVANRIFQADANETQFDLLIGRKPVSLAMSLNNRLLKDEQVVVARSVLIHKLMPSEQQMHVTCSLDVIHGAVQQIQFKVPDGYVISQVASELLSQWEIAPGDGGEVLNVQLRQPTRDDIVLQIVATRSVKQEDDWRAPNFRPLNIAGHVAVVGILADINLQTEKIQSQGAIPIDHEFLAAAIPETTLAAGFSNPVSIVAAFYAPQSDYSIEARFTAPPPRLVVKSNSRLVIEDSYLELQGGFSLLSAFDSRFGFDMELPAPWRFTEITGADGKPLAFDRSQSEQSTQAHVRLPQRIAMAEPTRVYFKARATPADWLDIWQENKIVFPVLKILGATAHTGAVGVSIKSDIRVMPTEIEGLETLDDQDKQKFDLQNDATPLAFRFKSDDYRLTLKLERLEPSINARTYTFYSIEPTQLGVHSELVFDVRSAKADTFRFQLPKTSPASISIQGIDNPLKDFFSTDTETTRTWTVQLSNATAGTIKLIVDYRQPIDEQQLAELVLAPIAVDNVQFQSSMLAIEGSSELDIELETAGRAVDVGELAEASYQPGRYVLGAFSWPSKNGIVTAKSTRRPIYPLPSAIVQRAEMVTSVSANGQTQTAARFQLVTKLPFLRIQLPADSALWSVQLDGKPAKPLVDKNTLLVSLVGTESDKLRDLQLVYQSNTSSIGLLGRIVTEAPTLWLHESADHQGLAVPLVDLNWRMVLPEGYQVSYVDGNFQSSQLAAQPSLIERFGTWLYAIGGGVDRDRGLVASAPYGPTGRPASDLFEGDQLITLDSGENDNENRDHLATRDRRIDETKSFEEEKKSEAAGNAPSGQKALVPGDKPAKPEGDSKQQAGQRDITRQWALSGLRSLNIELTETSNSIDFTSLGQQTRLEATVVHRSRITTLAVAVALIIGLIGVLLTRRSNREKILFVVAVILITGLLPMLGPVFEALRPVVEFSLLAAILVSLYFIVAATLGRFGRSANLVAVRLPIVLIAITLGLAAWQGADAQQVVNDTDQLRNLIEQLDRTKPVTLPTDAIIIPFDATDPDGQAKAQRLLLPYEHYLRLINKAEDKTTVDSPPLPVDFVLCSAQYSTQLTLDQDLTVNGSIVIELLTDKPVTVALPLAGGALAEARVDGQPAKLQFAPAPISNSKKSSKKNDETPKNQPSTSSVILLYLEGRGTKTLEFTVRLGLERQGGWRSINALLPVGLTRALNLTSVNEDTEIRLSSDADQRTIQAKPGETIETVLSDDGTLRLQWKPSAATTSIDQSLTAESEAVFDIREDGLRLAWRVALDFRGSERDSFTLNIPNGYLVERVTGENIRAWDVQKNATSQQLDVTLLSAAKNNESFTVELSQRDFSVNNQIKDIETPYLSVVGAALDRGVLTIRRSPVIELKTLETKSASRVDLNPAECRIDMAAIDADSSPLGITVYQSVRFVATPFTVRLAANLLPQSIKADTQTILRLGQSEADCEIRINYNVGPRPIYELSFDLPVSVEIDQVTAGKNEAWSIEKIDNRQRVRLFLPRGIQGDFSVFVDGSLADYTGGPIWDIPTIHIDGADLQNGQIAVQVDPALQVTTDNLQNCQLVLLSQLNNWLNPEQRGSSRLAIRTQGADYRATLKFSKIEPRITVETITNVRLTYFAIEETILLDFDIQQAGTRQIKFLLPNSMKSARIRAQLISETTIEPAAAPNTDMVQVTLNLQDDVMDSYRVVIENDRSLDNKNQIVPIPVVLVGETIGRYATLQNAGRDEINVQETEDFQPLNRQLNQYTNLKQKLGGGELTMAYVAKQDVPRPGLTYDTTWRQIINTVTASIEFSETIMVVDAGGAIAPYKRFMSTIAASSTWKLNCRRVPGC